MKNINEASVVLVCTDCENTRILYHGIKSDIPVTHIIAESAVPKKLIIQRRIKKLGWWTTISQLAFQVGIGPVIRKLSKGRIQQILREKGLDNTILPAAITTRLETVNSDAFIKKIQELQPDLILVNGTRIISAKTLAGLQCPIINVHVGITPLYRGVHGAYWALANADAAHCGVTIHAVDKGIDTGAILGQDIIEPGKNDNFITYPYLQFERAIALVKKIAPAVISGRFQFQPPPQGLSRLWYHPTIWQYLSNRFKGIK